MVKIPFEEATNIVLGHSHPECALNDSIIDNFKNHARSGESVFYSYHKLVRIINENKKLENVFLDISNNQLTKRLPDKEIWRDSSANEYGMLFSYFSFNELQMLFQNNQMLSLFLIKDYIKRIFTNDFDYPSVRGGYLYLERDKLQEQIKNSLKGEQSEKAKLCMISIEYISKIIQLCDENNLNLYLVRMPLHRDYLKYIDVIQDDLYFEVIEQYFSNQKFIDFKNFPLLDEDYGDLGHLNYKGAKKFSIWFDDILKNGLLEKTNKQEFIDEQMELMIR